MNPIYNIKKFMTDNPPKKIRILSDYNSDVLPPPIGRENPGVYCFFNSLMSILYSCPIFIERMIEASKLPESHKFCKLLIQEYNVVMKFKKGDVIKSSNLIDHFMNCLRNSEETKHTDYYKHIQQSDSVEGLELMLMMLEKTNPEIGDIFRYRYKRTFTCLKCEQVCLNKPEYQLTHKMFKMRPIKDPEATPEDIFYHNLTQYKNTFSDYACPICNKDNTGDEIRTSGLTKDVLSIIPEILGIQINHKWDSSTGRNIKKNQYFPLELKFKKCKEDAYLHYKLVGQIEQTGTTRGGHYWVRCLRDDGVYMINDSIVKKSEFKCTAETCFLVYHHYIPNLSGSSDSSGSSGSEL